MNRLRGRVTGRRVDFRAQTARRLVVLTGKGPAHVEPVRRNFVDLCHFARVFSLLFERAKIRARNIAVSGRWP